MLTGQKTYITCAATVVFAVIGWYLGKVSSDAAFQMIQVSIVGTFLRNGITTENAK